MRAALDECVPRRAVEWFDPGEASHVTALGLGGASNGRLLAALEELGFGVLVTADKNIPWQHSLAGRSIGVVVLPTNRWRLLLALAGLRVCERMPVSPEIVGRSPMITTGVLSQVRLIYSL